MSLNGDYDPQNIFAKILRDEAPAAKVYEDDQVLAFMDVFPQSRGHTLVVPKAEARNILDVDVEALQALIVRVQRVARAVRAALYPDGLRVILFNGGAGGHTVFHLHFHHIPVWADQPVRPHASGMADKDELARLAQQISAHVR